MNLNLRQQFGPDPSDAALREAFTRPPEIIDDITNYLDNVSSHWIFDPTKVRLPRSGRFSCAVDEAVAKLAESDDGASSVSVFHNNLEILATHCQSDDVDGKPLALRPGYKGSEWRNYSHVPNKEEVADVGTVGAMTTALKVATNAKMIRDDFAEEGNSIGVRTFKGAVRGAPVYFSEFIALNPSNSRRGLPILERVTVAETLISVRDTLRGLSDLDLELLVRAEVPLPVLEPPALGSKADEVPAYLRAEKPGRPRMVGVLRLYEFMNREITP